MGHIPCYKALAPSLLPEDISNKALYGEMKLNSPYMYCTYVTYVHLCALVCPVTGTLVCYILQAFLFTYIGCVLKLYLYRSYMYVCTYAYALLPLT